MGTCDSCDVNTATTGTIMTSGGEGSFCRTCSAGCLKHGCANVECGCPIEYCCVDCGEVLVTLRPGEPEPPLKCAECAALTRVEDKLAECEALHDEIKAVLAERKGETV